MMNTFASTCSRQLCTARWMSVSRRQSQSPTPMKWADKGYTTNKQTNNNNNTQHTTTTHNKTNKHKREESPQHVQWHERTESGVDGAPWPGCVSDDDAVILVPFCRAKNCSAVKLCRPAAIERRAGVEDGCCGGCGGAPEEETAEDESKAVPVPVPAPRVVPDTRAARGTDNAAGWSGTWWGAGTGVFAARWEMAGITSRTTW